MMSNQVVIVTDPDDTGLDGYRILLVDLHPSQSQVVSLSSLNAHLNDRLVVYNWNSSNDINWLIDKKEKCQLCKMNIPKFKIIQEPIKIIENGQIKEIVKITKVRIK